VQRHGFRQKTHHRYLFRYRVDSSTCPLLFDSLVTSEAAKFGDRRKCFESEKTKGDEEVERIIANWQTHHFGGGAERECVQVFMGQALFSVGSLQSALFWKGKEGVRVNGMEACSPMLAGLSAETVPEMFNLLLTLM